MTPMKTNDQRIYHVALHPNGKAFASFCGANAKRDATRAAGKTGSVTSVTGSDLKRLIMRH